MSANLKPHSQNFIQFKVVKGIDKKFNQLWYHLYRAVNETEQKRLGKEPAETQLETLCQYAQKTLKNNEKRKNFDIETEYDETAFKNVEEIIRKTDQELAKIVFLDDKKSQEQLKAEKDSSGANKYKNAVIEKRCFNLNQNMICETSRSETSNASRKNRRSESLLVTHSPRKRLDSLKPNAAACIKIISTNQIMANDNFNGPFLTSIKDTNRETPKKIQNEQTTTNIMKNISLFNTEDFNNSPLDMYKTLQPENSPKAVDLESKIQQIKEKISVLNTPLSDHAQIVLQKDPKSLQETISLEKQRKKEIMDFATKIYGKRKSKWPKMLELSNSPVKVTRNINNFKTPNSAKLARTATYSGLRNAHTTTSRNTKTTGFGRMYSMGNINNYTKSRSATRGKHRDRVNNILWNCLEEQQVNDWALEEANKMRQNIKGGLKTMSTVLNGPEKHIRKKEENIRAKLITRKKHLFIYGKSGLGRFLTEDGKDIIRLGDLMMNMNPKYPFMLKRFNDILDTDK